MITRIVKLTFQEKFVAEFLNHFELVKHEVNSFPGCRGMHLQQSLISPNIFFTYSVWEDEFSLEKYRTSQTFITIWPQIKPWFSERAEAWTCGQLFDGFKEKGV